MINNRALLITSSILVMGGVFLLSWLCWVKLRPGSPPYQYQLLLEGSIDAFPDLGLDAQADISIRKYALHVTENDKPLVIFHVGERDNSDAEAVLLDWQNQIGEALITIAPPIADLQKLLAAITNHVPKEALVLGWWDTTRRLDLLAGIETPFRKNLAQPLLIPDAWSGRREEIEKIEHHFWGLHNRKDVEKSDFNSFQEALLADTATGAARLRALVGEREAYLVLHISDIYKLSAMHPQQLGVGYRDFPNSGDLHGVINRIKDWLKNQGYQNYAVERREKTSLRVYFLTDIQSSETLIAQALPFTSSQPLLLEDIKAVYQHGGYWVFKIPPADTGYKK
ncbi:MAG: hydroxylamine oxidation protein HaoB [Gammaproteobacteria bacterium]|nr:MAG: hydroxylamine oxidation protein HaoB [Gammaproteobacteria bacterium]